MVNKDDSFDRTLNFVYFFFQMRDLDAFLMKKLN